LEVLLSCFQRGKVLILYLEEDFFTGACKKNIGEEKMDRSEECEEIFFSRSSFF